MLIETVALFVRYTLTVWGGERRDHACRGGQKFTRLFQASPVPFLVLAPDMPRLRISG